MKPHPERVAAELNESADLKKAVARTMASDIARAAETIIDAYRNGRKVLLCGNGGSAADAQHLAAELVGRFLKARAALPAIALTTDTSILTAVSNDSGFERVFARQVEALGATGDVLVVLTTSGASPNVLAAAEAALARGMAVIALTGEKGMKLKGGEVLVLAVPSAVPPRVQETHITIGHIICRLVEEALFPETA